VVANTDSKARPDAVASLSHGATSATSSRAQPDGLNGLQCSICLAVDLDGTFLGGSDGDRAELYRLIESSRDRVILAFVTGRDIPFVTSLCANGEVPRPDLVIGDVGTSVVTAPAWSPLSAIEAWIDDQWPGPEAAKHIMAAYPHIELQPVFGGRRLSYFYKDHAEINAIVPHIHAAGYDALSSANLYFDILPRGIAKGPTLLRVLEHLGISHDCVLTAGDTMNDFSLFQTGLNSVAVGNAEPRLRNAIVGMKNVYLAEAAGCGGILEALRHFKIVS
jgi:sucrose-6-phosphatase